MITFVKIFVKTRQKYNRSDFGIAMLVKLFSNFCERCVALLFSKVGFKEKRKLFMKGEERLFLPYGKERFCKPVRG